MCKIIVLLLVFIFIRLPGGAKTIYVAADGIDTNTGTKEHPLLTIQKAQSLASPGDTVFIRGGVYKVKTSQVHSYSRIQAFVTLLDKSGTEGHRIHYWAYPGEMPVFDCTEVKPEGFRVHVFEVTGSWIHLKGLEVVGVQVPVVNTNTQSICFSNAGGSHNIYEGLSMHDGQAIGFYLTSGSDNLVLNCDAYRNYDYTSQTGGGRNGGNVDGFGNHPSGGSVNNIFRGCRAWLNSDDGYDCISASEATVFENCWAFYNGYSPEFVSRADGNGFKAGGYGGRSLNGLPVQIPRNTIRFCLAVMNKANGFYANHHLEGNDWYNNSAYANGTNYNMLNRKAKTESDYLTDVPGYHHILRNNISLRPRGNDITNVDIQRCTIDHNTFSDVTLNATVEDFLSVDTAQLTAPRGPDGSLPLINFMRLKPGSKLANKGIEVGLPFAGKAPDIGCFETAKK